MHDFKLFPELTNGQMAVYYFDSPFKQITESFRAKVVKVTDGDTIRVETDFRDFDFPVRFLNIAAPERNEAGGEESKDWLTKRLLNEEVEIVVNPKNRVGKWGRILGKVVSKGMDINEELMFRGLAVSWQDRKAGLIPDFNKQLEVFR